LAKAVRHGETWNIHLSDAGLSPSGFLDFWFLRGPFPWSGSGFHFRLYFLLCAESLGSGRVGVISLSALVYFFPSEAV